MVFFLFFKQKTAYEMRISDWSSDVCSSDLLGVDTVVLIAFQLTQHPGWQFQRMGTAFQVQPAGFTRSSQSTAETSHVRVCREHIHVGQIYAAQVGPGRILVDRMKLHGCHWLAGVRSEEHTTELPSLMRNSYAVFCLKKKITQREHE